MTREDLADLVLARGVVAAGMAKRLRESVNLSRPEFVAATDGAFTVAALRAWEADNGAPGGPRASPTEGPSERSWGLRDDRPGPPTSSPPEEQAVLTVEETARVLGLGRSGAYEAIRRGDLPSIRIGRRVLIPTAALRRSSGSTNHPHRDGARVLEHMNLELGFDGWGRVPASGPEGG